MNQITMKVKAIDWSYGNIGAVWVLLDGGSCHIDWGDNQTSALAAPPYSLQPEWCGISHSYPVKSKEIQSEYYIVISSDENNIIGINAASGEMNVEDIDIKACQSIRYFRASWLISHFDLRTNPGIEKVHLEGNACSIADFSNSTELRELSFWYDSGAVKKLDLAKCDKLEYLDCRCAHSLTHIAISNRSSLKKFEYDDNTPLSGKYLEIIKRIIERNNVKNVVKP